MKENFFAIVAALAFAGTISSTAVYADDVELDVNEVAKTMNSCQMLYGNKTHCEKDVATKCEAEMTRTECKTLIQEAHSQVMEMETEVQ